MKVNIFNELFKMNVSIVLENGLPKMRGKRAREASARFKARRADIMDEVKKYDPSLALMHGVEHSVIDQCRAIAYAWEWTDYEWVQFWDRTEDIYGRKIDFTKAVNDIYTAEQVTHPERYE